MSQELDITVVVTCYNEQEFITATLDHVLTALHQVGCSYEVIVFDDASRDDSVKRVQRYIAEQANEPIALHVNQRNRGLGNNYVEAAFLGKGKYYRLCCGDDSEPVDVMVAVLRHLGEADIIIPYQIQKEVAGKPAYRKGLSRLFTFLVNMVSGYHIRYYNGMAVHLRYNVLRWHPSSYGFGFQADIITRLLDEGASYIQVPSSSVDRKGNRSSALTLRNFLSVCHTLLEIAIRRVRRMAYGDSSVRPREV